MNVGVPQPRAEQVNGTLFRVDESEIEWISLDAESAQADSLGHLIALPLSPEVRGTPGLAAGFTDFHEMELDYVFTFDDVCYVIEGEIRFTPEGEETFAVRAGECFVTRYGAKVHISVPERCRLFWVIYPCDWTEVRDAELERMEKGGER
ncbi:MAG TPA: cupin domain-containing protein [Thermoleophilaceae bacterium]|nr:cupin domain-containing protein [Thermoleophilaceae bacterium]